MKKTLLFFGGMVLGGLFLGTGMLLQQKGIFGSGGNSISMSQVPFLTVTSRVGIGSSTPTAKLAIQAASTDTNLSLLRIGSSTATANVQLFEVRNNGHIVKGGPSPTFVNCGASPSIVGNDSNGKITTNNAELCQLKFASPWQTPPVCFLNTIDPGGVVFASTTQGQAKFFDIQGAGLSDGSVVFYHCEEYR